MNHKVGTKGARTAAAIREAGLRLIYDKGYEAMSLRELAEEVELQPASLYNYFRTKQQLLFGLIHDHMQDLLASTEACLAASPDDPAAMLEAFVAHHVAYHLERKREVYIANFELRALDQKNYEIITRDRRSYEGKLITILQAGNDAGAFSVTDAKITAFAILAMLTGTCTWYKPDGRLSKLTVAKFYVDLVMNGFLARAEPG